eukprot:COSAG01_NODE_24634_length_772_cov_1.297177_1_plen_74_part_00
MTVSNENSHAHGLSIEASIYEAGLKAATKKLGGALAAKIAPGGRPGAVTSQAVRRYQISVPRWGHGSEGEADI